MNLPVWNPFHEMEDLLENNKLTDTYHRQYKATYLTAGEIGLFLHTI